MSFVRQLKKCSQKPVSQYGKFSWHISKEFRMKFQVTYPIPHFQEAERQHKVSWCRYKSKQRCPADSFTFGNLLAVVGI